MEASRGNQTEGSKMARWIADVRKCEDCGQVFDLNLKESRIEWESGHDCDLDGLLAYIQELEGSLK